MGGRDRVGGPYLLVLAGAVVGVVALIFRMPAWPAGLIMGVAVLGGALLRLTRSDAKAGDLAVRGRTADVIILVLLGGALTLSALLIVVL